MPWRDSSAVFCCSNTELRPSHPWSPHQSGHQQQSRSNHLFCFSDTMPGCADNACDCCKNDGLKTGAPDKEKEKRNYLNKLKWFRPNLRLLKLGPAKVLCPSTLTGVGNCLVRPCHGGTAHSGGPWKLWESPLRWNCSGIRSELWALMMGSSLGFSLTA